MTDRPARLWITARFVGFHSWADAPADRDYLGARHRHTFHVRVEVTGVHDDRAIEFHWLVGLLSDTLDDLWPEGRYGRELGGRSCEMAARELATRLARDIGAAVQVDVSEDGEAGATVMAL